MGRCFDNADFKSPKRQKCICDTSGALAGMSAKRMVLISISCSIFLEKQLWIVLHSSLLSLDIVQGIDGYRSGILH